jgi:hypothetical protein
MPVVLEIEQLDLNLRNLRPVEDQKSILRDSTLAQDQDPAATGIPDDSQFYHTSYLKYLEIAWQCHCPIVISPDIFWFTMMNELSGHIRDNVSHYESVFADPNTEKGKKCEILVPYRDPSILEVDQFTEIVESKCPANPKLFYPEFSTSTSNSRLAMKATFLEAVSPWYDYMMYLCGIPKVRVEGTEDDWKALIQGLTNILAAINPRDELRNYFKTLASIAHKIIYTAFHSGETDWWREIFYLQECGSGSDVEVKGWFTTMFMTQPSLAKIENFPTHIPSVPYTIVPNGDRYTFHVGLFHSRMDGDNFMVPDFGYLSNIYRGKQCESEKSSAT